MLLLFSHYRIDDGSYAKLALALASEFVPGMKVVESPPRKRGAPRTWKDARHGAVFVEVVEEIQQTRKRGIKDAIRIAQTRYPTKWGRYDPDTLVARFYEARKFFGYE